MDSVEKALNALLGVVDQCDRALAIMGDDDTSRAYREGILLIQKGALEGVTELGLVQLPHEMFDPQYHEAVGVIAGGEYGVIQLIIKRGWHDGDTIVRHAQVIVYSGEQVIETSGEAPDWLVEEPKHVHPTRRIKGPAGGNK